MTVDNVFHEDQEKSVKSRKMPSSRHVGPTGGSMVYFVMQVLSLSHVKRQLECLLHIQR